jgi:hypothetical protein
MARLSRDRKHPSTAKADEPPEGLIVIGIFGVVVGLIGRTIGGSAGESLAGIGCCMTVVGALVFGFLLIRWLYPNRGEE